MEMANYNMKMFAILSEMMLFDGDSSNQGIIKNDELKISKCHEMMRKNLQDDRSYDQNIQVIDTVLECCHQTFLINNIHENFKNNATFFLQLIHCYKLKKLQESPVHEQILYNYTKFMVDKFIKFMNSPNTKKTFAHIIIEILTSRENATILKHEIIYKIVKKYALTDYAFIENFLFFPAIQKMLKTYS